MSAGRRVFRLLLLAVLLAVLAGVYLFYRLEHPPRSGAPTGPATIVFAPGTSTAKIFATLAAEGVVRDTKLAEIYYRVYRAGTPLQAGEYQFDRPMPIDEIINRMSHGDVVKYPIVVPEGLTANETFQLFWSRGIGGPEGFRRALGETEFRKNFTPEMREKARALGFTPRQAVILASIIEKESGLKSEGPVIAAVYLNRLKKGMRLQADPTVMYALKKDGRWTGLLHRSDYSYDSPYNTYVNDGLPPGPICNPGLAALQ